MRMSVLETGTEGDTLYSRIGGAPVVERVIDALYERVQRDPELAPFFAATPMDRLRHMQREFFAVALGEDASWGAWELTRAHGGRGITAQHYSRFVSHLLEALAQVGVDSIDAQDVVTRLSVVQRDVTGESY